EDGIRDFHVTGVQTCALPILSKSFGAQTIWRDVTLTLPPGEISVLLGPSGTGKSVFLKSLVGLLRPEQGRVVINGVDICTCSEQIGRASGRGSASTCGSRGVQ